MNFTKELNIINLIFWVLVSIYAIYIMKTNYIRFRTNIKYFKYIIIIFAVEILCYFYLGFILGFLKSPYSHEIVGLIKNIFIKIIPIIGMELTRGILVFKNKNSKTKLVFITILLILVEIDYSVLSSLYSSKQELYEYICGNIIPIIAYGFLFTYLTEKSTYLVTLLFRIIYELFILILPIFTNIDWFVMGTGGVIVPLIIYVFFKNKFAKENRERMKKRTSIFSKIVYMETISFCVILSLFMLGVFRYESITILSNSMQPELAYSDVVIYKKLNEKELKEIPVGSILIYSIGKQNVVHRVVNVVEDGKNIKYQTKGDSNNVADSDLVKTEQIKGIYVFHVKYIGYPSAFLYQYFNNEKPEVEIK